MQSCRPLSLRVVCRTYATTTKKSLSGQPPIVSIENATFYRKYPSVADQHAASNRPLFPDLSFSISSDSDNQQYWAVVGPSNAGKTTFFEILRGQHLCVPPTARSFPYLSSDEAQLNDSSHRNLLRAIQYVGFDGGRGGVGKAGTRGAYLSARYESRREATDFSVLDYLKGNTDLNPLEEQGSKDTNGESLQKVITNLRLEALISMPMGNLSNGQMRRARIARALLGKPMLLLLDEPFMGLDPPTIMTLGPLLHNLAKAGSPRLILALRPQDPLPDWITHLVHLGPTLQVLHKGTRKNVLGKLTKDKGDRVEGHGTGNAGVVPQRGLPQIFADWRRSTKQERSMSRDGLPTHHPDICDQVGDALVEMQGVNVKYGDKQVLGGWRSEVDGKEKKGLWWTVRRGDRWGIFGPNGSGKTTLLSLIGSDHPQSYSLPIKIFGRGRLPQQGQPGISIFDIQARIGQSSPEIHAFFPRSHSIRRTIENAWADTFLGTPRLTYENDVVIDSCLRWFEAELNPDYTASEAKLVRSLSPTARQQESAPRSTDWADNIRFGDAPFSAQRVALLLRAIVKKPDMVVLDEAFSGMDTYVRDKCMLFLTWGETKSFGIATSRQGGKDRFVVNTEFELLGDNVFGGLSNDQALLCVSHVKEEVPGVIRDWISLPEAATGEAARFGRFKGPLEGHEKAWADIWRS